jgi:hypothetical protein
MYTDISLQQLKQILFVKNKNRKVITAPLFSLINKHQAHGATCGAVV